MIIRILNALAKAINDKVKLPKFLLIVLDDDFIKFTKFEGKGLHGMLGNLIECTAKAIQNLIKRSKTQLPIKALREDYPMIYWAAAPNHIFFDDDESRKKFNLCLDNAIKGYSNMRVIWIKEHWNPEDTNLVYKTNGLFTGFSARTYWKSIDSSMKFNIQKYLSSRRRILTTVSDTLTKKRKPEGQAGNKSEEDPMQRFFNHNKRQASDKYRWYRKNNNYILPRPK